MNITYPKYIVPVTIMFASWGGVIIMIIIIVTHHPATQGNSW